ARGYACGYLGGGILLAVNVWMTLSPQTFGLADQAAAVRWAFVSVAVWWALFTLPLWLRVHEPRPVRRPGAMVAIRSSVVELATTFRHICRQRHILFFLVAYWLYIDGVHTIIRMALYFGLCNGFVSTSSIVALRLVQFIGLPAGLSFGFLGERWDTSKAIYLSLAVYPRVTAWGYFLDHEWQFYVLAAIIGLVQGG